MADSIIRAVAVAYPTGAHRWPALVFGDWAVHPGLFDNMWRVSHVPTGGHVKVPRDLGADENGDTNLFDAIAVAEALVGIVLPVLPELGKALIADAIERMEKFIAEETDLLK